MPPVSFLTEFLGFSLTCSINVRIIPRSQERDLLPPLYYSGVWFCTTAELESNLSFTRSHKRLNMRKIHCESRFLILNCFLVSTFFLGQLPFYFFTLLGFTQILNFFNSCVNPIIYWCLSDQFSKGFKKILRCHKFGSWTRQHSSTSSSEPNVHSTANHNTVPTKVWRKGVTQWIGASRS